MRKKVAITRYITRILTGVVFTSLIVTNPAYAADTATEENQTAKITAPVLTDLRVLVDISGSMKKTDPKNLRRPAIRLLAGLIPEGSRSGVWNFAKQVNMTVKIGAVDDAWRNTAREQSKKINSVGLFTNIEEALRKVSFDWKTPDPGYKRNLILLTDGHVDISEDDKADEASKRRILKELLPAFEKAKVRIHTIALSDDVDEHLLTTLSSYTDGLHRKVASADDLQKLFLQMLEQAAPLDTLPLNDNRFNVDANINDMTLLVFNKDKTKPTTIVTPSKRTWSSKEHPSQVKWFSDDGYDLVTVKQPQQGQWKIMSPVDENNRVVVATNLKLKVNELPSFAMLGDVINVNAQLLEDAKPLTDKRLLEKFKFTLKKQNAGVDDQLYPMAKLVSNENVFSTQLPPMFKAGEYTFVIQAVSPTAEREIQHRLSVYDVPANVKIVEESTSFKVYVTPHANMLRPDSIKITAETEDKSQYVLVQHGEDWTFDVDKKYREKLFTINIDASRADDKPFKVSFNKILVATGESQKLVLETKPESEPAQETAKVAHAEEKPKEHDKKQPEEKKSEDKKHGEAEKESEINWTLIIISIVVGNLLIVAILGGGYIYLKKRKQKMKASLEGEMNDDSPVEDTGDNNKK